MYIAGPFRTAVPFWGQPSQILSNFSPKRDCGSKGVKVERRGASPITNHQRPMNTSDGSLSLKISRLTTKNNAIGNTGRDGEGDNCYFASHRAVGNRGGTRTSACASRVGCSLRKVTNSETHLWCDVEIATCTYDVQGQGLYTKLVTQAAPKINSQRQSPDRVPGMPVRSLAPAVQSGWLRLTRTRGLAVGQRC